jgi:protein-disulfide isomerase
VSRLFLAAGAALIPLFAAPGGPAAGEPEGSACRPGAGPAARAYRDTIGDAAVESLEPSARARLLDLLNSASCLCGCRHTLASCRADEPSCARSGALVFDLARLAGRGAADAELQARLRSQPILPRPRPASAPPAPSAASPREEGVAAAPEPALEPQRHDIPIAGAPARGREDAPVTIVEFADFQCPFCARSVPLLETLLRAYGDRVRLVFKHFPIESHVHARDAALAAMAAHEQGKFWEMHDRLFASGGRIDRQAALRAAGELGLDVRRFERDLDSPELAQRLERDRQDGLAAGLSGTPTFYVNGRRLRRVSGEDFRRAIREALAETPAAGPR